MVPLSRMHWAAHLGGAGGCLERCGRVKMTLFQQNPLCTHNLLPKPAGAILQCILRFFRVFLHLRSLLPAPSLVGTAALCAPNALSNTGSTGGHKAMFSEGSPLRLLSSAQSACSFPTTATPLHQPIWPGLFAQDLVSSEDWRSPYVVSSTIASPALFSFQIHDLTTTPFQPRGASGLHFVALHFFLLLTAYFILRHLLIRRSAHDSDFPASLSLLTSALGT